MIRTLKYASLFLWVLGPMSVYGFYATHGLPHVIWRYTFWDNGDGNNPFAERHYTSCTFIGWYGEYTVAAEAGYCPWLRFFQKGADQ